MIVMLAVMLLVFMGAQYFLPKPTPPPEQKPASSPAQPAPAAVPALSGPAAAAAARPDAGAPAAVPAKQGTAEVESVVENDLYKITFTNRGARVKSWILKTHQDDKGNPLDMVNQLAASQYGYPLELFSYDENLRKQLNSALYVPSATGTAKAPATLSYEYAANGLVARKSFSFDHNYVVQVKTEVSLNGAPVLAYPSWPAGLGDQLNGQQFATSRIDWYPVNGDIQRKAAHEGFIFKSHVANGNTISGPFHWAGVIDQYFAAVFLPDTPAQVSMVQFHNTVPRDPNEQDAEKRKKDVVSVLGGAVGHPNGPTSLRLFVGPKDLETLQHIHAYTTSAASGAKPDGPSIEGVIDFGTWFGVIAKPLFLALKWIHNHWIPNWGWAIVFVTIVLNVALFPLRFAGMKSALKMQKVQPEINHIRRKYKGLKFNDPRMAEQQREISEVMKREGVNQFAGCLPMVIQLPILVAFYSMLSAVNELRHAPWLWIHDLSAKDPLYLLPVLIIVTMFIMQRITPMTGMDPAQAKMMQVMMPMMIGFVSVTLPAGLGVYWVTGNLIGFGTQYLMNNSKHAREVREHLAKKAEKKGKK